MSDQFLLSSRVYDPGRKISEPGIYAGVPIQTYHEDCCDRPSISSGGLRTIDTKSAAHYFCKSPYAPEPEPQEVKEAWSFGRAAHTLLLGEAGFRDNFLIRPEEYPDAKTGEFKPWSGNAAWCKQWLANAALEKKDVLKPDAVQHIRGMAEVLAAHPLVRAGILNGYPERSIFWRRRFRISDGRLVTFWAKARPDNIPSDCDMVVDYKTADDAGPVSVRRAIGDHGYHQQLALAAEGIFATTGRRIKEFALVFQEKTPPYAINVKPVMTEAIEYGHRQNIRAMQRFAEGIGTGAWPGYDDDEVPAGLPDWLAKRLAFEAEAKLLPTVADGEDAPDEAPESI